MFPLYRRLPKFGFSNKVFRTEYQVVNVEDLETRFENGAKVNAATLAEAGLIGDREEEIKVLGNGQLSKKLTVEAQRFSASAAAKIEAAGGTVTRLGPQPKKKFVKRPAPRPEPEEKGEADEGKKGKKSSKGEEGKKGEKGPKGEKGGKGEKSEKKSQADAGAGQEGG
jgi:ribosomal protein L18E